MSLSILTTHCMLENAKALASSSLEPKQFNPRARWARVGVDDGLVNPTLLIP
jgi:hypothetical protein